MRSRDVIVGVVVVGACVAAACFRTEIPSEPPKAAGELHAAAPVVLGDYAWSVVQAKCTPCHNRPPFPHEIDLSHHAGLQSDQLEHWQDGLEQEVAPFGAPALTSTELDTLIRYSGGSLADVVVPDEITWSSSAVLAGLPDGAPLSGPGAPFFGYVIEDGYRDGWDGPSRWTKTTSGGVPAIRFSWGERAADGNLPASYLFPQLPHHNRIVEAVVTGEVVLGRWASVGLGGHDILRGGRNGRRYGARLQIDDRQIGLRSAPTGGFECCAWTDTNDPSLTGTLVAPGPGAGVFRFEFRETQAAGLVRFTARVWSATGALVADLHGESTRDAGRPGSFFLHRYSLGDAVWRNVELRAVTAAGDSIPGDPDPPPPPPPPVNLPTVTRPAYLQRLHETGFEVNLTTSPAAELVLVVQTGPGRRFPGALGTSHRLVASGLEPGYPHGYRIEMADGRVLLSGPRMVAETDVGREAFEVTIAATGDLGDDGEDQHLTGASILRMTPTPDLMVIAGDVVYPDGELSDYTRNLFNAMGSGLWSRVAAVPAMGNHDWHVNPAQNWEVIWNTWPDAGPVPSGRERWYVQRRGPVDIFVIDSGPDGSPVEAGAQLSWLAAALAASDAEWKIATWHHPGWTCTYKGIEGDIVDDVLPILEAHDVDMTLTGHAHLYERTHPMDGGQVLHVGEGPDYRNPDGIIHVVTGAGGKLVSGGCESNCSYRVTCNDDDVSWTYIRLIGRTLHVRQVRSANDAIIDQFSITKTDGDTPSDVPEMP